MSVSELRLIKRCAEFLPKTKTQIKGIPPCTRGIYVLFNHRYKMNKYDVVYVGMAAGVKTASVRGRLRVHFLTKGDLWTHFSIFEVWDNIREEEVRELEGMLRHIYRKDSHANKLGIQKSFKKLTKIKRKTHKDGWLKQSTP
ncbi:MAG: GIY-YIG nuclease family protein [Sedimentisphaerales bacterium]